ncbi:hypothetical protein KY348_00460 [Candidatus Woesearchaeota archaeon]|nr:hypothetical protein [Candidatus Woesearchaeota archaeon]
MSYGMNRMNKKAQETMSPEGGTLRIIWFVIVLLVLIIIVYFVATNFKLIKLPF